MIFMCFILRRMQSYPQVSASKLCERNLGMGKSSTGSPLHLQPVRIFYQCILWISLKLRLKVAHSNALYSHLILFRAWRGHRAHGHAIARCAELLIPKQNFTPKTLAGGLGLRQSRAYSKGACVMSAET